MGVWVFKESYTKLLKQTVFRETAGQRQGNPRMGFPDAYDPAE
jgi:hypothetical protein